MNNRIAKVAPSGEILSERPHNRPFTLYKMLMAEQKRKLKSRLRGIRFQPGDGVGVKMVVTSQ